MAKNHKEVWDFHMPRTSYPLDTVDKPGGMYDILSSQLEEHFETYPIAMLDLSLTEGGTNVAANLIDKIKADKPNTSTLLVYYKAIPDGTPRFYDDAVDILHIDHYVEIEKIKEVYDNIVILSYNKRIRQYRTGNEKGKPTQCYKPLFKLTRQAKRVLILTNRFFCEPDPRNLFYPFWLARGSHSPWMSAYKDPDRPKAFFEWEKLYEKPGGELVGPNSSIRLDMHKICYRLRPYYFSAKTENIKVLSTVYVRPVDLDPSTYSLLDSMNEVYQDYKDYGSHGGVSVSIGDDVYLYDREFKNGNLMNHITMQISGGILRFSDEDEDEDKTTFEDRILDNKEKIDWILNMYGDSENIAIRHFYSKEEVKLRQHFKKAFIFKDKYTSEVIKQLADKKAIIIYSIDSKATDLQNIISMLNKVSSDRESSAQIYILVAEKSDRNINHIFKVLKKLGAKSYVLDSDSIRDYDNVLRIYQSYDFTATSN